MSDIRKRLDEMKIRMQEDDFIAGRGLSNEVNIRIFCYDPKDEMVIRYFVEQLTKESLKYKVHIADLYDICLSILEDKKALKNIPKMEIKKGNQIIEKQIIDICKASVCAKKIANNISDDESLLLITGVGKVFPFMRAHSLLSGLQQEVNKPIILLYPGTFDGRYLRLFNKLKTSDYYRAFDMI